MRIFQLYITNPRLYYDTLRIFCGILRTFRIMQFKKEGVNQAAWRFPAGLMDCGLFIPFTIGEVLK